MARIAGVDLPKTKIGEIGLTYIYGIGRSNAQKILKKAGVDLNKKVQDWNDDEQNRIRTSDKQPSAHFELTVAVKKDRADVLSTFRFIEEVLGPNKI